MPIVVPATCLPILLNNESAYAAHTFPNLLAGHMFLRQRRALLLVLLGLIWYRDLQYAIDIVDRLPQKRSKPLHLRDQKLLVFH